MGATFDDLAVVEDHDDVGILDGRESVSDDEDGASFHERIHAALDEGFGARIDGRGCFVEDHHRRIADGGAGDGEKLTLSLAESGAVASEDGVVTLRQHTDEAVGVGKAGGGDALFIGSLQSAVADVLHHRAGEQVRILKHNAQRAAQVVLPDLVDVDAVVADLAILNVVKSVNQVGDGRLARAGRADERDLLPRRGVELDVVEHQLVVAVAEIDVIHHNIALQLTIFGFARVLVRVLPRPEAGAAVAFGDDAVFVLFRVDEGDIAVVHLGRFIQQVKDALRARQRHDDGIGLLRNLIDWLVKALIQRQEGDQRADGQAEVAAGGQQAADHRAEHIAQVAHRHRQRHDGVGDAVGVVGALTEGIVELLEAREILFLVAEDLDDLLAVHHLLDIAVDPAQILLLGDEEPPGALDALDGERHRRGDHEQRDDQQRHVEDNHRGHDAHNRHNAGNELRHGLGNHLPHGVDVVGIDAHNIAVGVRVKILDRQFFHMAEQIFSHIMKSSLCNVYHDQIVNIYRHYTHCIKHCHLTNCFCKRCKVRMVSQQKWRNVIVDQLLHK